MRIWALLFLLPPAAENFGLISRELRRHSWHLWCVLNYHAVVRAELSGPAPTLRVSPTVPNVRSQRRLTTSTHKVRSRDDG